MLATLIRLRGEREKDRERARDEEISPLYPLLVLDLKFVPVVLLRWLLTGSFPPTASAAADTATSLEISLPRPGVEG